MRTPARSTGLSAAALTLLVACAGLTVPALAAVGQSLASGGEAPAGGTVRGFRGVHLGMSLDQVKEELRREPLFFYRGDPDVSLVPATGDTLIEVQGRGFVERGYFQFHDSRLLVLIVALARDRVSYYEVYSALTENHGPAATLDPGSAVWRAEGVRLSLERPVVLKYVDTAVSDALDAEARAGIDYEEMARQAFLETL